MKKYITPDHHTFFGYYDVSPFSADDSKLLSLRTAFIHRSPKPADAASIGYFEIDDRIPNFIDLGVSTTWCWQQGARLQWFPKDPNRLILYNRLVDEEYGAVIQDIHSREIVHAVKSPLYGISPDGRWGLTLNFSRLQRLRPGYGYGHLADETKGQSVPENDGIWLVDLDTSRRDLLISVTEVAAYQPLESMKGAVHYFNHLSFSPSGGRFLFFHVWIRNGKRFTRLLTCDRDGKNRCALIQSGHVSHTTWKTDNEILAFSTHPETGIHYHLYADQNPTPRIVGENCLTTDGHPSYSPDKSALLTDTYPDRYRDQHLLLFDLRKEKVTPLGRFFSPLAYQGEWRCDLHPRWSQSGRFVGIDSAHEETRGQYLIAVGRE